MQVKVIDAEGAVQFCSFEQASRLVQVGVAQVQKLYPYTLSLGGMAQPSLTEAHPSHGPECSAHALTQEDALCLV